MLAFNPFLRPTVDELIEDPYFDDVRQFSSAYSAPNKINLPWETNDNKYMSIAEIRKMVVQEIEYYQRLKHEGIHALSPSPLTQKDENQIFFPQGHAYTNSQPSPN